MTMLLMMMWLLVYSLPALVSAQQETDTVQHTHQTNRDQGSEYTSGIGQHCTRDCSSTAPHHSLHIEDGYDHHSVPPSQGPIRVLFSINLRNVLGVDEIGERVSLETTLRMYWKDRRLKIRDEFLPSINNYLHLDNRFANHIWIPDIFIDQAISLRQPKLHLTPISLRIYKNSTLRYSTRVNYDVACNMDFHFYPHDVQTCLIKYESFGLTKDEMYLEWGQDNNVNKNISLAQFDVTVELSEYSTSYYDLSYPGLILKLTLRRKLSYHMVQTFLPSAVFLCIAWLALFLPPSRE
ncbi:glutamate-gated chloride channel isoform X2 [Eurytemora carolleeae]|uniref:glutamate-gated chloride channel isoform X2 n=1 Tax=Eurytemora carolleeae TaxID=1294199 RepID=UPI000C75DA4C|nr:glutamate-gated chloride channel isoform X2 [Eurytemora carolleeae]|eukprot:XP_023335147.1 glutamate-gated chloride channel-like isoform X2 [Eurytemora affinis]